MVDPILITGAARSGTSLTAGILSKCGVDLGKTCGATPYNKKGQFENEDVRNSITKPHLIYIGADPMGQDPLPQTQDILPIFNLRELVLSIYSKQTRSNRPWAIKGAKVCLMWKAWRQGFPEAVWVLVRRKRADIVASCMRTPFMKARKTEKAWEEWVDYHEESFKDIKYCGAKVVEFFPDSIVKGETRPAQNMVKQCGLEWNQKAVMEFVDAELWKGANGK